MLSLVANAGDSFSQIFTKSNGELEAFRNCHDRVIIDCFSWDKGASASNCNIGFEIPLIICVSTPHPAAVEFVKGGGWIQLTESILTVNPMARRSTVDASEIPKPQGQPPFGCGKKWYDGINYLLTVIN